MYNLTIKHNDGREATGVASYEKALRYVQTAIGAGAVAELETLEKQARSFMQKVQQRGLMTLSTDRGYFTVSNWSQ